VPAVIAKSSVSDALEIWRLDRAAEDTGCPESHIIGQDQQDIGRASWSLDALWKVRFRVLYGAPDLPIEGSVWLR
jgi:hypothetical protein